MKFPDGRNLAAALRAFGPEVAGRLGDQGLRAGAKLIADDMRGRVRVKSGELRDAITVVKDRDGSKGETRRYLIGFLYPAARRAHLLEFGSAHARAFPFIRPALDGSFSAAIDTIAEKMRSGVERTAKRLARKG